jgi:hypothetical protein
VLESVYPTIRRAVSDRLATWFGPFSGVGRLFTSSALELLRRETGVPVGAPANRHIGGFERRCCSSRS